MQFIRSRFSVVVAALVAALTILQVGIGVVGATGSTDAVSFPSGLDSGLATTGIALFAGIGAACVAVVLGVKALPLLVRYVFMWLKMAVGRR